MVVVRIKSDPSVARGQEPREWCETRAGGDVVEPQEALAAEGNADVPGVQDDGSHRAIDCLQFLSGQALRGDGARG